MSQFWKPGTEKPRLLDDEEGGVLFISSSASSSSSGYSHALLVLLLDQVLSSHMFAATVLTGWFSYCFVPAGMAMSALKSRGRGSRCSSTERQFSIWWRLMPLRSSLGRRAAVKPPKFLRSVSVVLSFLFNISKLPCDCCFQLLLLRGCGLELSDSRYLFASLGTGCVILHRKLVPVKW